MTKSSKIKDFISENVSEYPRLEGTEYEGYHLLGHKKKGDLGELIVTNKMQEFGYKVTPPKMYNDTWDKIIDGFETEIKLSVGATKDDKFMINHVKTKLSWERFIFYGVNIDKPSRFVCCTKEDMEKCWEETDLWKRQEGDDDKMLTGANVIKWINSPFCRDITTWKTPKKIINLEHFM